MVRLSSIPTFGRPRRRQRGRGLDHRRPVGGGGLLFVIGGLASIALLRHADEEDR